MIRVASSRAMDGLLGRVLPSCAAGSIAILAVLAGIHWVALLAGSAMVALAPIARDLAVRVMLISIGSLSAMAIVASLQWIRFGPVAVAVLIGIGMLVVVVTASATAAIPWRPSLLAADALVLLGAALLLLALVAPFVAASPDDVALDLARGFDQLNHFTMFSNFMTEASFDWTTQDGSDAVAAGYPMGIHALAVMGVILGPGVDMSATGDVLHQFAWVSALGVALSALLLGWVAVRVARATGPAELGDGRALAAAGIWLVLAPLSGSFAGVFEVGHAAFMGPAVVGIAASWLAIARAGQQPGRAMVVLLAAALALTGSYPPLIAGLVPAVLIIGAAQFGVRSRGWVIGLACVVGFLGLLALWRYRSAFEFVATASGEFSTPVITPLTMTGVTLALVLLTQSRGHTAPLRGLAVACGYAGAALVLGVLAMAVGFAPLQNYYVAKLLQATWWAELPVLVGVSAWGITHGLRGWSSSLRAPALVAGAAATGLVLALVPDGRYLGLGGPALLFQRLEERDRAHGLVQLIAASRISEPGTDVAAVMVRPSGWYFPVASSDSDPKPTIRTGSLASQWLNAVRGVRSATQDEAAMCMRGPADESAIPCLEAWLSSHDRLRLTIIVPDGSNGEAFRRLESRSAGRVEIVSVPPADGGRSEDGA